MTVSAVTMESKIVFFLLLALCNSVSSNTGNGTQRFQAEKFLDMLSRSFDPNVAYMDLMAALNKRLKLDSANSTVGGSPVDGDPSLMVDSVPHCPLAPPKPGASVTYTIESRAVGSRAFYQCDAGYEGRSLFIQCNNGGVWSTPSGWEGCKAVDCGTPPPSVLNAESSYTTTTFGSVVTYTCQTGYKPDKPFANVTCLDTGFWDTPSFTCQKFNLPSLDMSNLAALGAMFGGGGSAASSTNQNPLMAALLKNMQGFPGFPGMPQAPPTPAPTTTTPKPTIPSHFPMGFQLPSHLQSLLPNGLSSTQGMRPQDLMTLASVGLGSSHPASAPRDISQLLNSMHPMSIFGPSMGLGMPGPASASAHPAGAAAPPLEPEKVVEQREEMMIRAMMANAMKSMMQPRAQANGNTTAQARPTSNPALEMMTLMALQSGLSGGGAGAGSGASGGMDPMAMMLGGMNPAMLGFGGSGAAGGGLFGSLFGSA